jgi:hypothetical protein
VDQREQQEWPPQRHDTPVNGLDRHGDVQGLAAALHGVDHGPTNARPLQLGLELAPGLAVDGHNDVLAAQAGLPAVAEILAEAVDCAIPIVHKAL